MYHFKYVTKAEARKVRKKLKSEKQSIDGKMNGETTFCKL